MEKKLTSVYFDGDVYEAIAEAARIRERSISQVINQELRKVLLEKEGKRKEEK